MIVRGFDGFNFFHGKASKYIKDENEVFMYPYLEWILKSNAKHIEEKYK